MDVLLGFDPGGEGKFGWAVCIDKNDGLNVLAAGTADQPIVVFEEALPLLDHRRLEERCRILIHCEVLV